MPAYFAIAAHAGQRHGREPYEAHLAAVAQVPRDFGFGAPFEQAAWLRDVVGDTPVGLDEIAERFGGQVAGMVDAVTGPGETRQVRNARSHRGIEACPDTAVVKLADRIADVEAAPPGSDHIARYSREAEAFAVVVQPKVPPAMWARPIRAFDRPAT